MNDKGINKLIMKYKFSLVENYSYYMDIIGELNSQIPNFTKEINATESFEHIDIQNIELFTYPSFCRSFINNLKSELCDDENFTKSTINNIFMIMVEDRILSSSASSSGESEILGSECES